MKKEKDMIAFLASRRAKQVATRTRRYQKKNPKAGAGREVTYEKEPPDIQGKMRAREGMGQLAEVHQWQMDHGG